jgi:GT2 family glycosyltransferase
MKDLTVSIIVHHDFTHIYSALTSLYDNTTTPFDLYLTINAGDPADIQQLRSAFPAAHLIVNPEPRGFAANHNIILRQATTPFVALLNDDIYVYPGALDKLVDYLRQHPQAGLVGPAIHNPDGTLQLSVFSDPSIFRSLYIISGLSGLTRHGGPIRRTLQRLGIAQRLGVESLRTDLTTRPVPVVVGVAMVARREAYLEAGVMDEVSPFYGEEYGWHWRLRQHGWQVIFHPEVRIDHYNPAPVTTGWKLVAHRQATLEYYARYRPRWQLRLIQVAMIISHMAAALLTLLWDRTRSRHHRQIVQMACACRKRTSVLEKGA